MICQKGGGGCFSSTHGSLSGLDGLPLTLEKGFGMVEYVDPVAYELRTANMIAYLVAMTGREREVKGGELMAKIEERLG